MTFISEQSLHQLSQDIFKMLQDLAVAEIQCPGNTQTHTHKPTTITFRLYARVNNDWLIVIVS